MVEHPLQVLRHRRVAVEPQLPLAPAPVVPKQHGKPIHPVAFQPDRNGVVRSLRPEPEPNELGPAHLLLDRRWREYREFLRFGRLDDRTAALQQVANERSKVTHAGPSERE